MSLLPLLVVIGCSGGPAKNTGAQPAEKLDLQGQWRALIDTSGADSKDPLAVNAVVMAKSFESMNDLEFQSEDRFAMCAGGFLIEGSSKRSEKQVILTPQTVNGMPLEDASGAGVTLQASLLKPMTLSIVEGRLCHPPGQFGERLAYQKWDHIVATESFDGEEKYVGRWKVETITGITGAHRRRGFDYVLRKSWVNLQGDRRFQMRFTYFFEGTFEPTRSGVELTYSSGKMNLALRKNRLIIASPDGKVTVVLKRDGEG